MSLESDIREHWLEILRDPESYGYDKARGRLRRSETAFCALGVLGDIHPDLQWEHYENEEDKTRGWWTLVDKAADDNRYPVSSSSALPGSFLNRLGIDGTAAGVVAHTNDTTARFDKVADAVVEKGLFE